MNTSGHGASRTHLARSDLQVTRHDEPDIPIEVKLIHGVNQLWEISDQVLSKSRAIHLVEDHGEKFTDDFEHNKQMVQQLTDVESKEAPQLDCRLCHQHTASAESTEMRRIDVAQCGSTGTAPPYRFITQAKDELEALILHLTKQPFGRPKASLD